MLTSHSCQNAETREVVSVQLLAAMTHPSRVLNLDTKQSFVTYMQDMRHYPIKKKKRKKKSASTLTTYITNLLVEMEKARIPISLIGLSERVLLGK